MIKKKWNLKIIKASSLLMEVLDHYREQYEILCEKETVTEKEAEFVTWFEEMEELQGRVEDAAEPVE